LGPGGQKGCRKKGIQKTHEARRKREKGKGPIQRWWEKSGGVVVSMKHEKESLRGGEPKVHNSKKE